MKSPKPPPARDRAALEPQRRPGKLRVAALMQAGADVIAERGFEGATMAEVAARAGAPIGSLYRFFPNKEVLADALIQRYSQLIDVAFENIDGGREKLSTAAFADALLAVMPDLRSETKAVVALLESRSGSGKRAELHDALLRNIARKLTARNPHLSADAAQDIAVVLLQNMKTMKALSAEHGRNGDAGAIAELREMTRLYLASKLDEE